MIQVILLLALVTFAEAPWILSKDGGMVQVYHRSIPGSTIDEFRAVGRDSIPIAVGFQALADLPAYTEWIDYLVVSRVVSGQGTDTMLVYQKYDLPWPFDDRDIVVRVILKRDYAKGLLQAQLRSEAHAEIAVPEGCLRIPQMTGLIEMQYLSARFTHGTYSEKLELGGSVPNWLNQIFCKEIPFAVLTKLRAHCRKPKYVQAARLSAEEKGINAAIARGDLRP